jgi:hypothetical protein
MRSAGRDLIRLYEQSSGRPDPKDVMEIAKRNNLGPKGLRGIYQLVKESGALTAPTFEEKMAAKKDLYTTQQATQLQRQMNLYDYKQKQEAQRQAQKADRENAAAIFTANKLGIDAERLPEGVTTQNLLDINEQIKEQTNESLTLKDIQSDIDGVTKKIEGLRAGENITDRALSSSIPEAIQNLEQRRRKYIQAYKSLVGPESGPLYTMYDDLLNETPRDDPGGASETGGGGITGDVRQQSQDTIQQGINTMEPDPEISQQFKAENLSPGRVYRDQETGKLYYWDGKYAYPQN